MNAAVDRYAVLGNPVQHSRSPFIHAAFARQTAQGIEYLRLSCAIDGFEAAVHDFAAAGACGCNVTVPFKFRALPLAARRSARAVLAQAANTLRFDDHRGEGWYADNTDGIGLVRDIERHAGVALRGKRLLLVGAGGAAAGVLGPLIECAPGLIRVVNRSADKACALVRRHADAAGRHGVRLSAGGLHEAGRDFEVMINASASSLAGVAVPVATEVLARGALAVDLMYGAAAVPFMRWAHDAGATPRDGLGMLVEQAAEAFFLWRGVMPDTPPVLRALREQLADDAVRR